MGECTISSNSLVDSMRQNLDGYFSEIDNVTIIVKCYYNGVFYSQYENWKYVETK